MESSNFVSNLLAVRFALLMDSPPFSARPQLFFADFFRILCFQASTASSSTTISYALSNLPNVVFFMT